MADDKVAIWNQTPKLGRAPANGELLIGDGNGFELATLTAGAGASITNTAGGIEISATGSGGTITDVTATSPLSSSGGTTPDISLSGTVSVSNGGTGVSTLTAENVILGNGTNPVKFVAPGASGNLLTSNGSAWVSSAPQWNRIIKTSDQTSTSTTYADDTELKFPVSANKIYEYRGLVFILTANTGGLKHSVDGPASPTYVRLGLNLYALFQTSYGSNVITNTVDFNVSLTVPVAGVISNGANAGTVAMRWAQASGPSGTLRIYAGSWLEWAEVS